ncbi:MAG: glycosyltransferase [bacterium]|nr:glycosyltransferase [bacterium]
MSANFHNRNALAFQAYLDRAQGDFKPSETLRFDPHCHDFNSSEPDELWGRILRLPETWLSSEDLLRNLTAQGCQAKTITNHNNALSCWQMMDKGHDILPGAEFTCTFPEWTLKIHVLVYGFTPDQEVRLAKLRKNVYRFAAYCRQENLPTILPHPLFFYREGQQPPPDLLEKYAMLFERFEVLNGQRDVWQNHLTARWVAGIDDEKMRRWSKKHGLDPAEFCSHPFKKSVTGGSDDHIGAFAGSCGTLLEVPNLAERLKTEKASALALEALRAGRTRPFGLIAEEEKLHLALLDYFAQVARNIKDPGMLRLLLHRGSTSDKLSCLALGNLMMELQRHKYTMKFFTVFHQALAGKRPSFLLKHSVAKDYKPAIQWIDQLATAKQAGMEPFQKSLKKVLPGLFRSLEDILVRRVKEEVSGGLDLEALTQLDAEDLILRFEAPSRLRSLLGSEPTQGRRMSEVHLAKTLDRLSFPALASLVLAGSLLGSSRALYQNREFLNQVAAKIDAPQHPKRVLWLTDSLGDKNGVAKVLEATLDEARRRDLPIDFLVCDSEMESGEHLHVLKPLVEFDLPQFGGQKFRVPDLLEVHQLFQEGGYDRIVCSTELLMGPVALFLKEAFKVPAHFFMHTDWLDFAHRSLGLDQQGQDRVRRLLRALYSRFDGIFALNKEHGDWLASSQMEIPADQIHLTAHWVDQRFTPQAGARARFFGDLDPKAPVLLFAGRLSKEKGVMDLPYLYEKLQEQYPSAQMVFAGSGPAEAALKAAMPQARFLGWVDSAQLPELYSAVDLLLLPSRFDTFGCVVLEALSCGTPVAAYDTKGPRDILSQGGGILADNAKELAAKILAQLQSPSGLKSLHRPALQRSQDYQAQEIMDQLLSDLGLPQEPKTQKVSLAG